MQLYNIVVILTGAQREAKPIPIPALNLPAKRSSRNSVPSVSVVKTTSNHPIACAILHTNSDGLRPILSTTHPAIIALTSPEIAGSTYRMNSLCSMHIIAILPSWTFFYKTIVCLWYLQRNVSPQVTVWYFTCTASPVCSCESCSCSH